MNGFELQALLRILSVNQFKLSQEELLEVIQLREKLLISSNEDRMKRGFVDNMLFPRSIKFSSETVALAKELLARISVMRPDRFGYTELSERLRYWVWTAIGHFSAMYLSAHFAEPRSALMTFAFILGLLGMLSLIPCITLFQVRRIMKHLGLRKEKKSE